MSEYEEEIIKALKGIKKELSELGCLVFILFIALVIAIYILIQNGNSNLVIDNHKTTHIMQIKEQEE